MKRLLPWISLLAPSVFFSAHALAKTVKYELTATRGAINLSGKATVEHALKINEQIPGPLLEFTEGDDAEITVKNSIPGDELSIHWHGLLLPNEMDGVPYVTTPPIRSGENYTFRFKLRQSGTYWYHSHTHLQEQDGLYGPILIHSASKNISSHLKKAQDVVVVLSDWSDEEGHTILKNLKKDGEYYLHKKHTVRSWWGALRAGELGSYLSNEWSGMGGMDLSDVGYDVFLINGKKTSEITDFPPGTQVRLRIINAGASSYFHVSLCGEPLNVVAADGIDIEPVQTRRLLIGMAETYDAIFTVKKDIQCELRATAQDGTGHASLWLGKGNPVPAENIPSPNLYAPMEHGSHNTHPHTESHHHPVSPVQELSIDQIKSLKPTAFSKTLPHHRLKLKLDGDMGRYVWFIDGKAIHEERNLIIRASEVVELTLENETMMHHPMHLHGHFFRVINSFDSYSPLKHTVDVPPHGTRTIQFLANEPGEWMLHCHNLFHMKNGMARVVKYSTFVPKKEIVEHQSHDPHLHDHWYPLVQGLLSTNLAEGKLRLSQTRNQVDFKVEGRNQSKSFANFDEEWEIEGNLFFRRWINSQLSFFGGATLFEQRYRAVVGGSYTLPFQVHAEGWFSHHADFKIDLQRHFQWTSAFFSEVELSWVSEPLEKWHVEPECRFTLMYEPNWHWAVGFVLTEESLGVGAHFQL